MKKIESLTSEQELKLWQDIQKFLDIGRSCEPADRDLSESIFEKMYERIGEKKPYVWWVDSPAMVSIIINLLSEKKEDKENKIEPN